MRRGDDVASGGDAVLQRHVEALPLALPVIARSEATKQSSLPSDGLLRFARNDGKNHAAPSPRIGGWNESAVSQGKKIQVSCDTSVMYVSTSGRPFGLA